MTEETWQVKRYILLLLTCHEWEECLSIDVCGCSISFNLTIYVSLRLHSCLLYLTHLSWNKYQEKNKQYPKGMKTNLFILWPLKAEMRHCSVFTMFGGLPIPRNRNWSLALVVKKPRLSTSITHSFLELCSLLRKWEIILSRMKQGGLLVLLGLWALCHTAVLAAPQDFGKPGYTL